MKTFLLIVLCCGVARAASDPNMPIYAGNGPCYDRQTKQEIPCEDPMKRNDDGMEKLAQQSADKVTKEHPFKHKDYDVYITTVPMWFPSADKIVKAGLCPSGWKKSEYLLVRKIIGRNIEGQEETNWITIPVEICPDSGLLRIKP